MFVGPGFHLVAKNYTGIRQKQAVNCKLFAISSVKKPCADTLSAHGGKLLHQEHLARALDGLGQAALLMRGHAGVFARQDAALIGDILAEQVGVLEIQRVLGEVNFRLRAGRAIFCWAALAALVFFGIRLAWHNYLISLCKVWRRRAGLYFLTSSFSVCNFLLRLVV